MSSVIEAIGSAAANYGHVAARPTGIMLTAQGRGGIRRWHDGKSTPWQPNLIDLCADDWIAGPLEAVRLAIEATSEH